MECLPITTRAKRFPLKKGKSTVIAERKQFPLIFGLAITVHKSQGSTLAYSQDDLNRSTGKKTATGNNNYYYYWQPISQGQFYTLLFRTKSRDQLLLLNFEPEDIKVNESALDEMVRMRNESLFSWQHPLIELNVYLYVPIWYKVMEWSFRTFPQWQIYSIYSSLFCFAEININDSPVKHVDEILNDRKDIHKNTHHGLVLCYKVSKVNIIEVIEITSVLELWPIVPEIEKETVSLVIVYRMPSLLGYFIDDFISVINELPTRHRILIVGDFNLDQMLPEHVAKVNPLIQNFNLSQHSQYSTHIHGGILDLVFDTSNSNAVSFLLSPFSDHFVLFFQIWCIILYRI